MLVAKKLPDFSSYGYQALEELGRNRAGGRFTYKALKLPSGQPVVIKLFSFNGEDANWSDFKAHEREIDVLRSLDHPRIPRYLDSFETSTGVCMVQEYINGKNLAVPRSWTADEVKAMAIAILEILAALQARHPPVIHRDIKPENILLDGDLNIYLVDFGFARISSTEMATSSVVVGTTGFMPPEQLLNRQLTCASDLYSLGATLICLLSGIESYRLADFVDETYSLNVRQLLPNLEPGFCRWLEKMLAPRLTQRFPNAATALAALLPVNQMEYALVSASGETIQPTWEDNSDLPKVGSLKTSNSVGAVLATYSVDIIRDYFSGHKSLNLIGVVLTAALPTLMAVKFGISSFQMYQQDIPRQEIVAEAVKGVALGGTAIFVGAFLYLNRDD